MKKYKSEEINMIECYWHLIENKHLQTFTENKIFKVSWKLILKWKKMSKEDKARECSLAEVSWKIDLL